MIFRRVPGRSGRLLLTSTVLLSCAPLPGAGQPGTWPAFRYDNARSGASPDRLPTPLHRQWTYVPRHKPRPAWPEPCKEVHRMAFDHAPQVSIAGGLVFFGSSADHQIHALDLDTGGERWSFFTGGPVRFAPAVSGDRVLAASDDGCLYCLSAVDGQLQWRFRGGPRDERLMGNEQMMSRWPARTGVVVDGDTVYFTAGMWQPDGIYVHALRARDGSAIWTNDTSSNIYMGLPHSSMEGISSVAPQGQMVLLDDTLLVPCGRAMPAGFDRKTGELLFCDNGSDKLHHAGGSWVAAARGMFFCGRRPVHGHPHVTLREAEPVPGEGILAWDCRTGTQRLALAGKHRVVIDGDTMYASGDGEVIAADMDALIERARSYYGSGAVDPDLPKPYVRPMMYWKGAGSPWGPWKVVPIAAKSATKWQSELGRTYELVLAGRTLVAGGRGAVTAFDADDGRRVWQTSIEGDARGLAAAGGKLVVSSTTGEIHCFGARAEPPVRIVTPATAEASSSAEVAAKAVRLLERTGVTAGYCLLLGAGDGRLAYELVRRSELVVHCVEPEARKVAAARRVLEAAGVYGVRVVVHHGGFDPLPYPSYVGNLVLLDEELTGGVGDCAAAELYRVLRPCGGVLCVLRSTSGPSALAQWLEAGGVPGNEIQASGDRLQVVRGALPGAAEWTHPYCDASRPAASTDSRVRLPLKMLWFGKPGPARIISRHWRMPVPLFVAGRMFVSGEHHLMALDAYNGRQIWCREISDVGRYPGKYRGGGAVADERSVYAAVGTSCLRLDAATGETVQTYSVPPQVRDMDVLGNPIRKALDAGGRKARPTPNQVGWEFLAVTDDLVIGSVGQPNFAWTGWPEAHPECAHVFALGKADGELRWHYPARESVSPNAICIKGDRLYLIDRKGRAGLERSERRGEVAQGTKALKALDLATGETVWETDKGLAGRLLWMGGDVLLVTKGKASAYSAADGGLLWSKPMRGHAYPVIVGGTFYLYPGAYDLRTGERRRRLHPLTNTPVAWQMSYKGGCGSFSGSPGALFCRSGASGIYDLARDSGMGWLGQVRPSCWVNMIAAGGMLLYPEGASSCSCPYNYQTSLAMVPDSRHEQWFVFPGAGTPPGSRIRRLALNFGAVGDKRDARDTLWTGYPRPFRPGALTVPLLLKSIPAYYRHNADHLQVGGTDMPWLYASGCAGLRRAELDLFLEEPASAPPCARPPTVDGRLDDPCWDGKAPLVLTTDNQDTDETASAYMRSDSEGLYIGFRRDAAVQDGAPLPWRAETAGTDTRPWDDDSFGVRLWDAGKRAGVYLHLSNTGASFDGRTDSSMYGLIGSDASWNGTWHRAVRSEPETWSAEIAVPWTTLAEAGIRRDGLSVYLESVNRTGVGPPRMQYRHRTLRRLYLFQRLVPVAYAEPPPHPRRFYDVVLHFAELEDVGPGERVFDVALQGEAVLSGVDVVKEAGGRNTALVRTVSGVEARDKLTIELVSRSPEPPIISGLELRYDEQKALEMVKQAANRELVAHWRFDGRDGKAVIDSARGGNDGEIFGATRTAGKLGGALRFDGEDDYVTCGSGEDLDVAGGFTVSAWVNVESYHEDVYHDVILSKGTDAYSIFLHRKDGGGLQGYVRIGSEHKPLPIHAHEPNEWHHIAMTVRDGQQRTYYDGVLQGTWHHSGALGTTDRNLLIGYSESFPSQGHFHGMIDDVRVSSAVLSSEEIQWLFESGK